MEGHRYVSAGFEAEHCRLALLASRSDRTGRPVTERSYAHRDVLDKLGIKAGQKVRMVDNVDLVDSDLLRRVEERAQVDLDNRQLDVVLVSVGPATDVVSLLRFWKERIAPSGGIWLLTEKRGYEGYVDQQQLITAGLEAGLVDNKVCSVSPRVSALRFVIRRKDR